LDSGDHRHLIALRRALHRLAEQSGRERKTAARLTDEIGHLTPDSIVDRLGGHGLAAVFEGSNPGPTVLLRADMDALPIDEYLTVDHGSVNPGVAHKCGHDGHMAIVIGVAQCIARARPKCGRLVVLFQPSEETGEGAAAVIGDPAFESCRPDVALAVHNLPGYALGRVVIRPGPFACASRGLTIELMGVTSHAAQPEHGRSPALAVARIIEAWSRAGQLSADFDQSVQATVVHAAVGRRAFGTTPGDGRVMVTLRAATDEMIEKVGAELRSVGRRIGEGYGLTVEFSQDEPFPATVNDPQVVDVIVETARALGHDIEQPPCPFAWSEDFGHFGAICPSALVGLGAGSGVPALHNPMYDFPDALLPYGVTLLEGTVRHWLECESRGLERAFDTP
jgi:amidohydrolase